LLHEITPAGVAGGGGVEDDVHQLADVEHCGRLKVKSGDDRVFVGRRGDEDECRGRGRDRGRCGSRLLQGGGLGLLLLEAEAGSQDAAMGSGSWRLDVLGLLDDGLEPSVEGNNLGVVRHGDRTG
jgi:hypothetical protein